MPSGGSRPGTGPKNKYGEETKQVQTSVPISKEEDFKKKRDKILEGYETKEYKIYKRKKKK